MIEPNLDNLHLEEDQDQTAEHTVEQIRQESHEVEQPEQAQAAGEVQPKQAQPIGEVQAKKEPTDERESVVNSGDVSRDDIERTSSPVPQTIKETKKPAPKTEEDSKISAYARLDFENFTFFVQTLQVVLGRKLNEELLHVSAHHAVDVHLSSQRAISRKHAKIFYNFGTQRFELLALGRNGAFVDDNFIEKGITVPLKDGTKIQIGDILFQFVLPLSEHDDDSTPIKQLNPSDALNLRSNMMARKIIKEEVPIKVEQVAPKAKPAAQNETTATAKTSNIPALNQSRRDSILKIRRLSSARRKSLASASAEEINDILKELGVASIDAIDEEDGLDPQLKSIQAKTYDDELLLGLDQEIASLGPLIDAHNQDLQESEPRKTDDSMGIRPLMGKPALIQPPNRLYNRQLSTPLTPPANVSNNFMSAKAPKLEAHVLSMIAEPCAVRPRPPLRAITVSSQASLANFGVPKTIEEPSKFPKVPRRRNVARQSAKKIYALEETPEQYRSKPPISLSLMITAILKPAAEGLTLNEMYDVLKDVYPYYKYCPEGWQFAVAHNVKLNKIFKRKFKRDGEWAFVMDEMFINEREKVRKKQQEWFEQQRIARGEQYAYTSGSAPSFGSSVPSFGNSAPFPGNTSITTPATPATPLGGPSAKPKTIAELASEIKRDTKPLFSAPNNIKAQLAANRSQGLPLNSGTKKSLTYLQKELFTLYKSRKLLYNTATTTEIITKALATTIAQVNMIGAKAGCGDNALSFLVERAPQQVSKILDIALSKSIKERQQSEGELKEASPVESSPTPKMNRPPSYNATPGKLLRPMSFAKPGSSLSKPPTFLSNKMEKREREGDDENRRKQAKTQ